MMMMMMMMMMFITPGADRLKGTILYYIINSIYAAITPKSPYCNPLNLVILQAYSVIIFECSWVVVRRHA
jgi:hypothetical protein